VEAVNEDRNGNLWLGTAGGLAMLDKNRKRMAVYRHSEKDSTSLINNKIEGIVEDRSGTLWICTRGGLSELIPTTPHRFRNYLLDPKQSDPVEGKTVSASCRIVNKSLVSTYGRGLNRLEAHGRHTLSRMRLLGDSRELDPFAG
jgi:ligand-binding sensor domain-containing protein